MDRFWKYYGQGNITWGGLTEAEASNPDDAELGSSSVAITDDAALEEYTFEEPPRDAWVSIGSPLARREEDTIDPRAGTAGSTNQGQETMVGGRPRRTQRAPRWTADYMMRDTEGL